MNQNNHKPPRESPLLRQRVLDIAKDDTRNPNTMKWKDVAPPGGDVDQELKRNLDPTEYSNAHKWWYNNREKGREGLKEIINKIETAVQLRAAVNAAGSGGNANA